MVKVGLAVKAGLRGNAGLRLDGAGLELGKVGLAVNAGLRGNAGLGLGKVGLVTLVDEDAERAPALSIAVPTCIWLSS